VQCGEARNRQRRRLGIAETGPNRVALAEMIKQFLLIIVSLGLAKA
jgi:hypothetical protein